MKPSLNRPSVLDLRSLVRIARGRQRNVFLLHGRDLGLNYPDVPLVLKVPRNFERKNRLTLSKRVLRRLYPASSLRVIRKEVDYLEKFLKKYVGPRHHIPIPAFMGFVETSDGTGALWEAIFDEQGQLAPTLQNLTDKNKLVEALEPLNHFVQTCLQNDLVATDMNYRNLVYGQESGNKQIWIVDGFGDHRILSLRGVSRHYNCRQLIKCFEKVSQQTGLIYDTRTNRFSLRAT